MGRVYLDLIEVTINWLVDCCDCYFIVVKFCYFICANCYCLLFVPVDVVAVVLGLFSLLSFTDVESFYLYFFSLVIVFWSSSTLWVLIVMNYVTRHYLNY